MTTHESGRLRRKRSRNSEVPGHVFWLRWVGANALATIVTPIVGTLASLAMGGMAVYFSSVIYRRLAERLGLLISGPTDTAINWGIAIFLVGPGLAATGWGLGTFVGWLQSIALRGLIADPNQWVRSSRRGWSVGLPLGSVLAAFLAFLAVRSIRGNPAIAGPEVVFPFVVGAIASVVFATAMANLVGALFQTRHVPARPGQGIWWVIANTFAWAGGLLAAGVVAQLEYLMMTSGAGILESASDVFRGTPFWLAYNLAMPLFAVVAVLGAMGASAGAISGVVLHQLAGGYAATPVDEGC